MTTIAGLARAGGVVVETVRFYQRLFIGATIYDRTFRAFDAATGKLLWEAGLP